MSHINYTIILILIVLFLIYNYNHKSSEQYEHYQNSRSCSKTDIDNAIYSYQTNVLNQHIL
jgi:uncharacterized membrane protein